MLMTSANSSITEPGIRLSKTPIAVTGKIRLPANVNLSNVISGPTRLKSGATAPPKKGRAKRERRTTDMKAPAKKTAAKKPAAKAPAKKAPAKKKK